MPDETSSQTAEAVVHERMGSEVRASVIAEYMRQRGVLVEQVVELNDKAQWNHYKSALGDIQVELERIDKIVGEMLAPLNQGLDGKTP